MNSQNIDKYITEICSKLGEMINKEQITPSYRTILQDAPELIKIQARASLKMQEDRTGLNLLVAVLYSQEFLDYMKKLDQAYSSCSPEDKIKVSQCQLAPFQISLLAKQLVLAPGIIKQYEAIAKQ